MTDATARTAGDLGSSVAAPGNTTSSSTTPDGPTPGSPTPGSPTPGIPDSNAPGPGTPSPSEPESAATATHIGAVVYFSSASENTARFIKNCHLPEAGLNVYRIPLRPKSAPLIVNEPFVIVVPTYGGGDISKALPPQVRRFLNDRGNRSLLRGVIASGNTNFGDAFCAAGDVIAAKCHVPFLYSFELTGTPEDMRKVREGLRDFFLRLSDGRTV